MLVVSRSKLEASLCRQSYFDFVQRFWPVVVNEVAVWNWHIEFLCMEFQKLVERVAKRKPKEYDLLVNISPGTTKSILCSIMLGPWAWTVDPTLRIICGSHKVNLTEDFARKSLRILQSEKYQELFPEIILTNESNRLIANTRGGERMIASPGASPTGQHAHLISIDDPLDPNQALSEVELKAANTWLSHTIPSRMVNISLTPIILTMQRLAMDDPSAEMRKRPGTKHFSFPARISDLVRPRSMRKFYVDGLFDSVRLPEAALKKKELELGTYAFSGQYDQRPVPFGGEIFNTSLIQIFPTAGAMMPGKIVRYWDKAGSAGYGCYTVGVKMGMDSARCLWIIHVVRGQWEADKREKIIRQTAEMDGKAVLVAVEEEGGSGGKESAGLTVKNLHGFRVLRDRPKGDKMTRAYPFSAQMNGGNVKMVRGEWNAAYLEELQHFCETAKFKDQCDASSGGYAVLCRKTIVGAY